MIERIQKSCTTNSDKYCWKVGCWHEYDNDDDVDDNDDDNEDEDNVNDKDEDNNDDSDNDDKDNEDDDDDDKNDDDDDSSDGLKTITVIGEELEEDNLQIPNYLWH